MPRLECKRLLTLLALSREHEVYVILGLYTDCILIFPTKKQYVQAAQVLPCRLPEPVRVRNAAPAQATTSSRT